MPTLLEAVTTPTGTFHFMVQRNVDLGKSRPIVIQPWVGKNKGPRGKRKPKS